ncbi:hypothetical protein [Pacificibacter sp. AS14]|uniref:RraA family protein n=1 Tax=Alphaproteobacteria TaxID=28211 RepID=UPI00316C2737
MTVTIHMPTQTSLTDAQITPWRDIPVAIAADLVPAEQIDPLIRPLCPPGAQPKLFGRAVTVECEPPDFGAVLHALDLVQPGDVLVISARGHKEEAMIGEILGGHLRARGVSGLVCDGAVRDVAELAGWPDFSVFARSVTPRGPIGVSQGVVNQPVTVGGRLVTPGDLIMGDDDGLIALSPESVLSYIHDANAKVTLEAEWIAGLAAGQSVAEVFGLVSPKQA